MERLWSLAVATSGNRWQMQEARKPLKQAKTVAAGCDQLPESFHGKKGVSGSSPEEGSHETPPTTGLLFRGLEPVFQSAFGRGVNLGGARS